MSHNNGHSLSLSPGPPRGLRGRGVGQSLRVSEAPRDRLGQVSAEGAGPEDETGWSLWRQHSQRCTGAGGQPPLQPPLQAAQRGGS